MAAAAGGRRQEELDPRAKNAIRGATTADRTAGRLLDPGLRAGPYAMNSSCQRM
jgi:hypothetical protein